jgi:SAM-dependent methyltransferase
VSAADAGAAGRLTNPSGSYRTSSDPRIAELEERRLAALGRTRDPMSIEVMQRTGVGPGWKCLEVGGGGGSFARWLAARVAPTGAVLSTDVDLRFHGESVPCLELREHDITRDPLPENHFDLVHARAVLQHLPERELAIDRMLAALVPGGWIVLEDSDFTTFDEQPLPEAFGKLAALMRPTTGPETGRDPYCGRKHMAWLRARGVRDLEVMGRVWTMRGGEDSAEWWVLGMEYAGPRLVAAGAVSQETFAQAMREGRDPELRLLSPTSIAVSGRKP